MCRVFCRADSNAPTKQKSKMGHSGRSSNILFNLFPKLKIGLQGCSQFKSISSLVFRRCISFFESESWHLSVFKSRHIVLWEYQTAKTLSRLVSVLDLMIKGWNETGHEKIERIEPKRSSYMHIYDQLFWANRSRLKTETRDNRWV